ncbi:mechanosensitive ion channel family protein [Vibrio pectenicida]|uniref:Mechanosensitive ion channel family protein n=1 Tax=Vibrio pectenicida TaxID=62763 RepID=A0A7Y4A2M0_9VIBR|nr:mechanosensitive ion channel domain-containing protein [Vibrio pectenicida]NOH73313.1 mechanosensitive ion channel family protein [Vibrio pectenicida]
MNEWVISNQWILSAMLAIVVLSARWAVIRYLRRLPDDENEMPKRWVNAVKNATNFLIAIGLIIIWLSELRFVALSIATFIVALVIATREFIQCFSGYLYQTSTRIFFIGDWIKIGQHYGEVVKSDWLSTTLLEIDMESMCYGYTGKTLTIPNSQLVVSSVQNLNYMRRFVTHTFVIVRDSDSINLFKAKPFLLNKAKEYCASFSDVAQRYSALLEKRLGVNNSIKSEPSVCITTSNLGKNQVAITLFCPTREAVNIEQKLVEDFMAFWHDEIDRLNLENKEKT